MKMFKKAVAFLLISSIAISDIASAAMKSQSGSGSQSESESSSSRVVPRQIRAASYGDGLTSRAPLSPVRSPVVLPASLVDTAPSGEGGAPALVHEMDRSVEGDGDRPASDTSRETTPPTESPPVSSHSPRSDGSFGATDVQIQDGASNASSHASSPGTRTPPGPSKPAVGLATEPGADPSGLPSGLLPLKSPIHTRQNITPLTENATPLGAGVGTGTREPVTPTRNPPSPLGNIQGHDVVDYTPPEPAAAGSIGDRQTCSWFFGCWNGLTRCAKGFWSRARCCKKSGHTATHDENEHQPLLGHAHAQGHDEEAGTRGIAELPFIPAFQDPENVTALEAQKSLLIFLKALAKLTPKERKEFQKTTHSKIPQEVLERLDQFFEELTPEEKETLQAFRGDPKGAAPHATHGAVVHGKAVHASHGPADPAQRDLLDHLSRFLQGLNTTDHGLFQTFQQDLSHPFVKFLNNLEPEEKKNLHTVQREIIDGKDTWLQRCAKGVGLLFTGAEAAVAVTIFLGGLVYVADRFHWEFLDELFLAPKAQVIQASLILITLSKSFLNMDLFKQAATYLTSKDIEKTRIAAVFLACLVPILLEPYYVAAPMLHNIAEDAGYPSYQKYFENFIWIFCPVMFVVSSASNIAAGWKVWDTLFEWKESLTHWKETSSSRFAHLWQKVPNPFEKCCRAKSSSHSHAPDPSLLEDLETFENLLQTIPRLPDTDIRVSLHHIDAAKDELQRTIPLLSDQRKAAETFLIADYLLSLGETIGPKKEITRGYKYEDIVVNTIVTLGSPARLLLLQRVLQTFFGIAAPQEISQKLAWSFATLGFLPQSLLEREDIKTCLKQVVRNENLGHTSFPYVRGVLKSTAVLTSTVMLVLIGAACFEVVDSHNFSDWAMLAGAPIIVAEATTLIGTFHDNYTRRMGTAFAKFYTAIGKKCCGREPRVDCERDRLYRLVEEMRNVYPSLHPIHQEFKKIKKGGLHPLHTNP